MKKHSKTRAENRDKSATENTSGSIRAGKWSPEKIEEFKSTIASYTERGDYKGALPLVKKALREFPNELQVRFNYAKILGDWADELPPKQKSKLKREALKILRPLTRSLAGMAPADRFSICLNYYYQGESWNSMYGFGKRFEKHNKTKALYAQGLAATSKAFELREQKAASGGARWAKKAVEAWRKYDFRKERYYFPVYNYAKALALTGDKTNARKQLERAAKLSQRPVTDWEFADVLKLISN